MRGIIFTEYMDFASNLAGDKALDAVLSGLEGKITGAYTSVGNYSFDEFAVIHGCLSSHLGLDSSVLAYQFGYTLIARFRALFPSYFDGVESGLDFLDKVSVHIHEEVKKLYPDSNPPDILLKRENGQPVELVYQSHRPLAPVAHGLACACLEDFGDPFRISGSVTQGTTTIFKLESL